MRWSTPFDRSPRLAIVLGALLSLTGCPADDSSSSSGDGSSTGGVPTTGTPTTMGPGGDTSTSMTPSDSSGAPATSTGMATGSGGSDSGGSSGTGADSSGVVPGAETPCDGVVYECGDQLDNDGDGFFDLFDPECTGPCDDDEGSFQTGLPGDNVDCIQDCFFDGNSGQGDDGCFWDLTCDPANPGASIMCEYDGSMACDNLPHNPDMCAAFCEPYVPPGCDCFGCCTVELPDGTTVDIFLNSSPECAIDNLDACETCTSEADVCGHPCEPGTCELCFGQNELPEGCKTNECANDLPCEVNEDCPTDFYCLNLCCYPPPPG